MSDFPTAYDKVPSFTSNSTGAWRHEPGCPVLTAGGDPQCTCTPERKKIQSLQAEIDRLLTLTSEQATEIVGKDKEIARLKTALEQLLSACGDATTGRDTKAASVLYHAESNARAVLLQLKGK